MQTARKAHSLPCTLRDELLDSVIHVIQGGGKKKSSSWITPHLQQSSSSRELTTRLWHSCFDCLCWINAIKSAVNLFTMERIEELFQVQSLVHPYVQLGIKLLLLPLPLLTRFLSTSNLSILHPSIRKHQYKDLTLPLDWFQGCKPCSLVEQLSFSTKKTYGAV